MADLLTNLTITLLMLIPVAAAFHFLRRHDVTLVQPREVRNWNALDEHPDA